MTVPFTDIDAAKKNRERIAGERAERKKHLDTYYALRDTPLGIHP